MGGHQYLTWDAENHLASISGGVSKSYLYDADGVRVKKVAPNGAATYTPFPHYEVSDGVVTKYYFFAGQRIAMKRNGVLTYLHADHLGSTVLETNANGQIVSDQRYYAYGKQRDAGPVSTDYRFTGQKQDASGLVYMSARYYDPVLGQFISPDTLVPDATNVQDYNRYGYARGNPMKFNDPSGHYSNDEIMQHYGCGDWGCVEAQFGDGGSHAGLWRGCWRRCAQSPSVRACSIPAPPAARPAARL